MSKSSCCGASRSGLRRDEAPSGIEPLYDENAPLCGLAHVQGWRAAEKSKLLGHQRAVGYLTKYLTGKHPPEFLREIKGPVVTVSRSLTRKTGVTMQRLRRVRRLWAARWGLCAMPNWPLEEFTAVAQLLDNRARRPRGP